jgi:hypothetical protein
VPSTRCARRERAHRQGSARAGAALQRDVACPPAALRDDGGACCGHTAARMVLRQGRVRRSAAAGRCGTAGGSAAELGDGTQLRGARFGPHSLPASAALPRGSTSPAPPRAAGRSIRLLCGSTDCSCPRTSARCVCGWRAGKGEGAARRGDKIIAFSSTILGDARPALHPRQTQQAVRIRPGAWKSRPPIPLCNALCGRGCSQGERWRQNEQAGALCTRLTREKDEEGGDGAYQHHLNFNLGSDRSGCSRRSCQ